MYYLDLHSLYKPTTSKQRKAVRLDLSREVRNELMASRLKIQHNKCFYCGCEVGMNAHLDHLIPVYYGGTNRKSNLVAACKECNMTKMTDQIEISNIYTINNYLRLQEAFAKWQAKVAKRPRLKRYQPKKVRLYRTYRADLLKKI